MALNGLICAEVPLRIYSLIHEGNLACKKLDVGRNDSTRGLHDF